MPAASLLLSVNGTSILPQNIEELHVIYDINSIFTTGSVVFKDYSTQLAELVQMGGQVLVQYLSDAGKPTLSANLRVISYKKVPSKDPSIIDRVAATLVSDWFFSQTAVSRGYFGNISTMVQDVFGEPKKSLKDALSSIVIGSGADPTTFKKFKLEKSTDSPRIRYQIQEGPAAFLNKIKKYAVAGTSPMFLFADRNKVLNLRSRSAIESSTVRYSIVPFLNAKEIASPVKGKPVMSAFALSFFTEGEQAASSKSYEFQINHVPFVDRPAILSDMQIFNQETKENLPSVTSSDYHFSSWSISPSEAAAIAINENERESNNLFYAIAIVPSISTNDLDLGDVVQVRTNTKKESGHYFVKTIDAYFSEGKAYSKLVLARLRGL